MTGAPASLWIRLLDDDPCFRHNARWIMDLLAAFGFGFGLGAGFEQFAKHVANFVVNNMNFAVHCCHNKYTY